MLYKLLTVGKLSLHSQSSVVVESSSMGNSKRGSSISVAGGSNVGVVGVGHDGLSNGLLDNGLSSNGDGVGDGIGLVNMDGVGDLNDLLLVDRNVIGNLNTSLNIDRLVDGVDLGLGLDNGGVDSLGSLEDGGDLDGEMGGGGLVDGGVVSGNVAGLAIVHLLGDNRGGLVNGGHTLSLGVNRVGGGQGDSRSCGNSHRGSIESGHWGSSKVSSSISKGFQHIQGFLRGAGW